MFENSKKEINENIVPGKNAGTSATGLKETLLAVLDDARDAISDANFGIIGAITTSQELSVLNSLPDGVYEAQTSGLYKNGLTAKEGYYTRFRKTANTWSLESETKVPAYDDTVLKQRVIDTETKVDEFIENFAVEVDKEFDANSNNAIANSAVTKIHNLLKGFDSLGKTDIMSSAVNSGIFDGNGSVISSSSGRYSINIPTNGAKYIDYRISNYATTNISFIWGVRQNNTKVLLVNGSTSSGSIAKAEGVDISEFSHLNICIYSGRIENKYIYIYTDLNANEHTTVKDYIDKNSNIKIKNVVNLNKLSKRVMTINNEDALNYSFLSLKNIVLPQNTFKIKYIGGYGHSTENSESFVPLLGITKNGDYEVIIGSKLANTSSSFEVEVEIEPNKYSHVSYSSRNVSKVGLEFHYNEKNIKSINNHILENQTHIVTLPVLCSCEAGWYSSFIQGNIETYGNYTFGWFIEGTSANLCIFKMNNTTGEFEYTNLSKLGLSITEVKKDGHNGFSLTIDKNGYIIIGGDSHGTALKSVISNNPLDISSWKNIAIVSSGQNAITYLQFIKTKENKIFALYRTGGSGNGDVWFVNYDDNAKTFINHLLLIDATSEGAGNPYLQSPMIDRNGVIKIAFGFRQSAANWNTMSGIYYIESADDGVTWRKSDNVTNYTLPIKKSTGERIYIANPGSGYVNQNGACIDINENLVTVLQQRRTIDNVTSDWLTLIYKENNVWKSKFILDTQKVNEDGGLYYSNYSRPSLFCNENGDIIALLRKEVNSNYTMIALNTNDLTYKTIASNVVHSINFDIQYARDYFVVKMLVASKPKTLEPIINHTTDYSLNRFINLSIYQHKFL
ncbi:BNR-4 repeat-containing protein [Empedobacter sp.]|uniref:BNR-4 repeat-containing protein n=1 Tax=Empedobacter sp. TaxID=1927715 RepID=UPI0028A1FCCB|nr:BNR-4 repeat-containing protein [Empedobacter sp.]